MNTPPDKSRAGEAELRFKRSLSAEEACRDINPTKAPPGMPTARWRESSQRGRRESKTLGWYRGHHAGVWDSYIALRKKFPKAAEALRESYGMNKREEI